MTSPTPPVSGPGALSRRTDRSPAQAMRDLPNADYGENATFTDLQRGAPLAQSFGPEGGAPPGAGAAGSVIPFGAPSLMTGTPVTDGAALGAGVGMEALGMSPEAEDVEVDRATLAAYVAALEVMANLPGSSSASRNLVRRMKARL